MRTKLIEERKKNGFTQEEIAKKLNIARTTYTGYEKGLFSPSLQTAIKIKEILNYRKDDIFLDCNDSTTNQNKKR